jgi:hypothetical protein
MSDRPAGVKSTRSPGTDGAWLMLGADVPADWEATVAPGDRPWDRDDIAALFFDCIVEARPIGGES